MQSFFERHEPRTHIDHTSIDFASCWCSDNAHNSNCSCTKSIMKRSFSAPLPPLHPNTSEMPPKRAVTFSTFFSPARLREIMSGSSSTPTATPPPLAEATTRPSFKSYGNAIIMDASPKKMSYKEAGRSKKFEIKSSIKDHLYQQFARYGMELSECLEFLKYMENDLLSMRGEMQTPVEKLIVDKLASLTLKQRSYHEAS